MLSDVAQGAILSPSIFNCFISSLQPLRVENSIFKFADDVAILIPHFKDPQDENHCQSEILHIKRWYQDHGLKLNTNKSKRMLIKKDNFRPQYSCLNEFEEVNSIKILGIIISNNLSWSSHINHSISRASRNLHILRICKHFMEKSDLVKIYMSLSQSHLDYGCQLYVGSITHEDSVNISRIVKRAHRIICGIDCSLNCLPHPKTRRLELAKNHFNQP